MAKSKIAVFSFVCSLIIILNLVIIFYMIAVITPGGVFGFITLFLLAIITFISSIFGLFSIKRNKLEGKGITIFALILSGLIVLLLLYIIISLIIDPLSLSFLT